MGTARSLAKLFGIVANGGKFVGKTLISEKVIKEFQNTSKTSIDLVLFHETTFAQGMLTLKNPLVSDLRHYPGERNQGWVVQSSVSTILALNQLDLAEGFNAKINAKLVTTFLLNNRALNFDDF
jgi:hypothetical protein